MVLQANKAEVISMKDKKYVFLFVPALVMAFLFFTACGDMYIMGTSRHDRGYGPPPPHAPAHGYRARTHDGAEIVFDANLGVYVVVGMHDHYYYKNRYYRKHAGYWEHSGHMHGDWRSAERKHVPPRLRPQDEPGKKPGPRR